MRDPLEQRPKSKGAPANAAVASVWMVWLLRPSIQIGLILSVGLGLYLHTLHAPFIFDDYPCIVENPAIRSFEFFIDFDKVRALNIDSDIKNNFALRPVVYLSFALNYAFGGLREFGFHLVNTAIHLFNALLVYALATVTLKQAPLRTSGREALPLNALLPLLIALLFVAHPLQTQAVTYITQRFTSLAVLFYLLALLLYIGARTAKTPLARWGCYGFSLLITYLAMKTKAIAFTLPVIMLIYDLLFLGGKRRQRIIWLFPFFLAMVIIPGTLIWLVATDGVEDPRWKINQSMNLINFAKVSRWDYLKTQFGVIVIYLRMLFLPVGQNLDHDYRLARSFFEPRIIGSFLLLFSLFAGAIRLALRSFRAKERSAERLIAFGIIWFFVTISMSSSIIPITDLLVEYRVYLPSFGFFFALIVAAAVAVDKGFVPRQVFLGGAALTIVLFAGTTIARNYVYGDEIRMMQDVVAKSPEKLRAHAGLASAYLVRERYEEAIVEFTRVLQNNPNDANMLVSLGFAQLVRGEFDDAIKQLTRAIEVDPDNFYAHGNLGLVYLNKGWQEDAEKELRAALRINPHFGAARNSLAQLYDEQGRIDEAIEQYRELLNSYPDHQDTATRLQQLEDGR